MDCIERKDRLAVSDAEKRGHKMKNNNYASFFKTKPKKVERYIRCRKCGGNMEWSRGFPPEIKCPKCGYTVYPKPYEPDCIKLPETFEEYYELYEKVRTQNEII